MNKQNSILHKIIDIEKWQALQDSLALVTGMAIITVDYKGAPITAHSSCHQFCQLVRADKELHRHCEKCDSRGGLEAARLNKPYIYLCHNNIVDAAIPILDDDKYIGAVMMGQVMLTKESDEKSLETICNPLDREQIGKCTEKYAACYDHLPLMTLPQVKTNVEMLFHLCNYIIEEAMQKDLALKFCMEHAPDIFGRGNPVDISGYSVKSVEAITQRITNAIADVRLQKTSKEDSAVKTNNRILRPAFDYINDHKNEPCSLKTMAEVCHISASYFSRLFTKETGENFSTYFTRLKLKMAKQLLETTDISVSQISSDIGFSDAGYFIKTFKSHEGITPSVYRKYYGKH